MSVIDNLKKERSVSPERLNTILEVREQNQEKQRLFRNHPINNFIKNQR